MDLILHLGAHRGGSTAFGRCLMRNAPLLAGEGVAVWPPQELRAIKNFLNAPRLEAEVLAGLEPARAKLRKLDSDLAVCWRMAATEARADAPAMPAKVVVSEENMLGSMPENLRAASLYPALSQRLTAFARRFPRAPVRIGMGLRDYATLWPSAYNYVLPRTALPPFAELAPQLAGLARGWPVVVAEMAALFPKAEILLWQHETMTPSRMVRIAAELIGRPAAAGLRGMKRRVNMAGDGADNARIHHLRHSEPGLSYAEIRARLPALRDSIPDGPPRFSDAEAAQLSARYAADMERLSSQGGRVRVVPADQVTP